jgi:hypothetical protein
MTHNPICPRCNERIDDSYGYDLDYGDYEEHFCMNCERSVKIRKEKEKLR